MIKLFFKAFAKGMKKFGSNISVIINTILLLPVYIFGVGLSAIIAKVSKKKLLDTKLFKEDKTYWSDLNLKKKSLEEYYKQF